MGNILDYLNWRGDILFSQDPFNPIDNLILSELCYMDFTDILSSFPNARSLSLKNAVNRLFKRTKKEDIVMGVIVPQTIVELTDQLRFSQRFSKVRLSNYINITNVAERIQFSAMCMEIDENTIYVAFRGTDDTLIGWQEDFNMLCEFPVPSQISAVNYLNRIARMFPKRKIYVGGHSKGGNLAVYASIYCKEKVQQRIITCFSNDGPGFYKDFVNEEKFAKVKDKIIKILPEGAIVGLIFNEYAGKRMIVKSSARGMFQHDGFSWQVNRNQFDCVNELNKNAILLDEKISNRINSLNESQRKEFSNDLYQFILRTNQETLIECSKNKLSLLKACRGLNIKNARLFIEVMIQIIRFGGL